MSKIAIKCAVAGLVILLAILVIAKWGAGSSGTNAGVRNDQAGALGQAMELFVETIEQAYSQEQEGGGQHYDPFWIWTLEEIAQRAECHEIAKAAALEWSQASEEEVEALVSNDDYRRLTGKGSPLLLRLLLEGLGTDSASELALLPPETASAVANTIIHSHSQPISLTRWSLTTRVIAWYVCDPDMGGVTTDPLGPDRRGVYVEPNGTLNITEIDRLYSSSFDRMLSGVAEAWASGNKAKLKIEGSKREIKANGEWLLGELAEANFSTMDVCKQTVRDISSRSESRDLRNTLRYLRLTLDEFSRIQNCL